LVEGRRSDRLQESEGGKEALPIIDSYLVHLKSWPEIKKRLEEGETLASVTKWLKASETEVHDKSDDAVMKALSRVRTSLRDAKTKTLVQVEAQIAKERIGELAAMPESAPKRKQGYVDVLEKLEELIETQMSRIAMGRAIEEKVKYLIKTLTGDIAEARELLKTAFEVQQELHIQPRRPIDMRVAKAEAMPFEARQRIGRALDLIRQRMKQAGVKEPNLDEAAKIAMAEAMDIAEVPDTEGDVIDVLPTDASPTEGVPKAAIPMTLIEGKVSVQSEASQELPFEE
jgi:hypothetical protein